MSRTTQSNSQPEPRYKLDSVKVYSGLTSEELFKTISDLQIKYPSIKDITIWAFEYEDGNELSIEFKRHETNEERINRDRLEANWKRLEDERDRKTYERLKAKYEPVV